MPLDTKYGQAYGILYSASDPTHVLLDIDLLLISSSASWAFMSATWAHSLSRGVPVLLLLVSQRHCNSPGGL